MTAIFNEMEDKDRRVRGPYARLSEWLSSL